MKEAIILTDPEEMRRARLNQPRVSLEELARRMEQHRQASERFFEEGRNETSKLGPKPQVAGSKDPS